MTWMMLLTLVGLLLFVTTSTWVLIDAIHLGIRAPNGKGAKKGFLDYGPAVLFLGCLALWIVVFPAYLVKRRRHLASSVLPAGEEVYVDCTSCGTRLSISPSLRGQTLMCPNCQGQFMAPGPRRSSWYRGQGPAAMAWTLYAIGLVCAAINLSRVDFARVMQGKNLLKPMAKAAIEQEVLKGIQERIASNPATASTQVKSLTLTQESEGLYRGTVLTQTGDRPDEIEVTVFVEGGQIRWELLPKHAAEARSLEWNLQDPNAASNGNVAVALQKILRNSDCKTEAEAAAPALVVQGVSGYYGKPLKLSGRVYNISALAADSAFGKAIRGRPGSELLLVSSDKTVVDMLCTTANPNVKAGDSATVYGFAVGTHQVPNPAGGTVTRLVLVGSECELGANR